MALGLTPRVNLKEKVDLQCPNCGCNFSRLRQVMLDQQYAGRPPTCTSCSNSRASLDKWKNASQEQKTHVIRSLVAGGNKFRDEETPEEKAERFRKIGNSGSAYSVKRQWESIKSNPVKYEAIRKQRSETFKKHWDSLTPEQKSNRVANALKSNGRSKTCEKFLQCLDMVGIPTNREVPISGFIVDGLHTESRTIIEFYGDIWHCNPKKFSDPELFCPRLNRTVGQQWARDRKRLGVFYSLGYAVVTVWESEWNANQESEIKRILSVVNRGI